MSSRPHAHAQHALELEVKVNNLRQQAIERIDQACTVATTLPFLREQIRSIARSNSVQISQIMSEAAAHSAQIDACPHLSDAKSAPAITFPITKDSFDSAVIALIGDEKHAQLVHSGYNRADFCLEVARAAFVGEMDGDNGLSLAIVKTVATRLWRGDGTLGLGN